MHTYFDVLGGAEMTSLSFLDSLIQNKIKSKLYCVSPPIIPGNDFCEMIQIKQNKFPLFWRYQRMLEIKKLFGKVSDVDLLFIMNGGFTIQESSARKIYLYCHTTFSPEADYTKKHLTGITASYSKQIQTYIKNSFEILKKDNVNLISNSEFTKKEIKQNCNKDSIIIYPPVQIEKYKKFLNTPKEAKIITIARFSAEKNLDKTIKIFNETGIPAEIVGNAKYKNQFKVLENLQKIKGDNVTIYSNVSSEKVSKLLSTAKVYLHTSKETFGISVVEAISAGCIPFVPDNSAHPETVPFPDLRYRDEEALNKKIIQAMNGEFDHLLPELEKHIQKFSEKNFQDAMLKIIQNT